MSPISADRCTPDADEHKANVDDPRCRERGHVSRGSSGVEMMYQDFYRLKRMPFQITPDPTFFFVSASHQAALDTLTAGIDTRQGLVTITGVSGAGKTTLVRAYLARVAPPQRTTIVLWQAPLSFLEVLTLMARHYQVPVTTDAPEALWTHIQQRLRQEYREGRNVALIIDEAQHIPRETLAQVLALTPLTPTGEPLLQLVLVGQPALEPLLAQVRPRVELRRLHTVIRPLTPAESMAYIRQRVARVALPGGPIFTPEALAALVRHTNGVPRDVNCLCANVLQAGFQAQQQPITPALVQQVVAASTGLKPCPRGQRGLTAAAGVVLLMGLLWGPPFGLRPQALRHSPAGRTPALLEVPPPVRTPPVVSLSPPPPGASLLDSAGGPTPGEDDVHRASVESQERQHLESPPALPPPRASLPLRGTAFVRGTTVPARPTEITSPRHGATVGQKITVAGVLAGLRPEQHVFVCVQSQAFGRLIYPQGEVFPDRTGQWTVTSIYATPGYRYATFLVHTTDPTAVALLSTPRARKYGLHDLPPRTERLGPPVVVMRE
jgi:general secretion pathway protein A